MAWPQTCDHQNKQIIMFNYLHFCIHFKSIVTNSNQVVHYLYLYFLYSTLTLLQNAKSWLFLKNLHKN
jgi:hypothetical protein